MSTRRHVSHRGNHLLAAMAPADLELLLPHLEVAECAHGTVLVDAGDRISHVLFPHSAVICLMAVMPKSATTEVATIGPEGMAGFEALLGSEKATTRTLVQVPGRASRIEVGILSKVMNKRASLRSLLMRYIRAFMVQVTQSVACNGHHKLEQRCCRWLLMAHDRARRDSFPMTQEFFADMLGVHRPALTVVASSLRDRGLIRYTRGVLTIVDRSGLERASCECYGIVKRAYAQIISRPSLKRSTSRATA
jgi:CRP-like cAMP-binding protein